MKRKGMGKGKGKGKARAKVKAPDLAAVFIPPLAMVLGGAEREKGRPLSEREVLTIRDRSIAVMLRPEAAAEMAASRGYRDIDPEDCWADWHRLRVEYSGLGYLPKFVLCAVGDEAFADKARALLSAESVEHEVRERDDRMGTAFRAAAFRTDPSLTEMDLAAIDRHQSVVYALSKNFSAGEALSTARRMLALGARLLDAGGTALKCESSGIAHGRARWRALARSADDESLFRAFVQYPIGPARNDYYTCGLHLLGMPDLIASKAALGGDPAASGALFATFALYLLLECAPGQFRSGHHFRLDRGAPRYTVSWEACNGYDEDDFFFNSFGRYRFEPATGTGSGRSSGRKKGVGPRG
jgi:hypothetical protein